MRVEAQIHQEKLHQITNANLAEALRHKAILFNQFEIHAVRLNGGRQIAFKHLHRPVTSRHVKA